MMSIEQKLHLAEPGTKLVYHVGHTTKHCRYLDIVRKLYDEGRAELAQRRAGEAFAFEIQFRRKRKVPPFEHSFKYAAMPIAGRDYVRPENRI